MRLKKAASSLLALLLVFSLTSCGDKDEVQNDVEVSKDITDIMGKPKDTEDVGETGKEDDTESQGEIDKEAADLEDILNGNSKEDKSDDSKQIKKDTLDTDKILSSLCEFMVIDCGQADSILIHSNSFNVLVDAGEDKSAEPIIKELDNLGVKKIDLLVATHPHADHIGGMKAIINEYEIGDILMSPTGHTSQTYEDLLNIIDSNELTITKAVPGLKLDYNGLTIKVISPSEDYSDLNDNSIVLVASYGDIDMLFTGDAGMKAEKDFVDYIDGHIEILKVGHHGSNTATSDNLLNITNPDIAIISCGKDNKYDHPHSETMDKLNKHDIEVYRTDTDGTIDIRTDGKSYTVETDNTVGKVDKGEAVNGSGTENKTDSSNQGNMTESKTENKVDSKPDGNSSQGGVTVYASENSKKYHSTSECSRLYTSKVINELTESEADNLGLTKCSKCW